MQDSSTNPTLARYAQFGQSFDYDGTYTPGDSNFYKLNRNPHYNINVSAPSHLTLTDRWSADFTPYPWRGYGNAGIGVPLFNTGNFQGTQPITEAIDLPFPLPGSGGAQALPAFEDSQYRGGFTAKTDYRLGVNNCFAGWWFDYSNDHDGEPFSPVGHDGEASSVWGEVDDIKTVGGLRLLGQDILRPASRRPSSTGTAPACCPARSTSRC